MRMRAIRLGRAWMRCGSCSALVADVAQTATLKALRALQSADVVLYDRLVAPEILEMARREAGRMLVGKAGGGAQCKQDDINALMVKIALQGKRVVRFERVEWQCVVAQGRLHVGPRRIYTLGCVCFLAIDNVVEDGEPKVGHAKLVQVRIGKGDGGFESRPVFGDTVPFLADIASWFAHLLQKAIEILIGDTHRWLQTLVE